MPALRPWSFPRFLPTDLDRQVLALCSPRRSPLAAADTSAVLARAEALGLFPLAFHRLRRSGASLAPEWEVRFRANAARNLYFDHEQARLLAELSAASVCATPLKGTSLAALAYGDPALRSQVDLDLYVAPRDLPAALECLSRAGYREATPSAVPASRLARAGDEFTSERQLVSTRNGMPLLLELHWRILPLSEGELRRALGSQTTAGLPDHLNLLYLCLRAATDRWGSLKLLCDLAHWLERQPRSNPFPGLAPTSGHATLERGRPPDWERVLDLAGRLGLRRILCLTLDALGIYFGTQAPPGVVESLASARPRAFPAFAVANPFAPPENPSPGAHHCLRLALRERFRDRARYAARLLRPTADDLAALRLPPGFGFLYWGVRWLRLTGLLTEGWKRQSGSFGTVHP